MYVSSKSPEIEIDARVDRNCAIWFAKDSFDPSTYLNGRRVAGESFLKGFLKHADVDECVALVKGQTALTRSKTLWRKQASIRLYGEYFAINQMQFI